MIDSRRPTPWNMGDSPETKAVPVPPSRDIRAPWEDAAGEGSVTELATEIDDETIRALELDAQRGEPRVDWRG